MLELENIVVDDQEQDQEYWSPQKAQARGHYHNFHRRSRSQSDNMQFMHEFTWLFM